MRLILALLVITGCTLIGYALAGAASRRAKLVSGILNAMRLLQAEMLENLMPLSDALQKSDSSAFKQTGERLKHMPVKQAWRSVRTELSERGGELDSLTHEDILPLDMFFDGVGTSGNAALSELFANVIRAMERRELEAREQCSARNKLYTRMGLLTGLLIALAFI